MAPKKAISLLDDGQYFELVDLRDYVGKRKTIVTGKSKNHRHKRQDKRKN